MSAKRDGHWILKLWDEMTLQGITYWRQETCKGLKGGGGEKRDLKHDVEEMGTCPEGSISRCSCCNQ